MDEHIWGRGFINGTIKRLTFSLMVGCKWKRIFGVKRIAKIEALKKFFE
jgi:hypothetical protein